MGGKKVNNQWDYFIKNNPKSICRELLLENMEFYFNNYADKNDPFFDYKKNKWKKIILDKNDIFENMLERLIEEEVEKRFQQKIEEYETERFERIMDEKNE